MDKLDIINKAEALFKDGLMKLGDRKARSAMILFRKASNLGHAQAEIYLRILRKNRRLSQIWKDIILAAENKT